MVALIALVVLTACGSTSSSTSSSADLSQLATCLDAHGVQVSAPLSRKAIHLALRNAGKPARKTADAACQQYEAGVLNLPKKNKKG